MRNEDSARVRVRRLTGPDVDDDVWDRTAGVWRATGGTVDTGLRAALTTGRATLVVAEQGPRLLAFAVDPPTTGLPSLDAPLVREGVTTSAVSGALGGWSS